MTSKALLSIGKRVIENYLFVVQAEIDSALVRRAHLFRELDQFFDDFLRCDRAVVICVECFLEHLKARPLLHPRYGGEPAALNKVPFQTHVHFVAEQLGEWLRRDVFVFQSANFGKDRSPRMLTSTCTR